MRIGEATASATWEPASTLPAELVSEFESGMHRELVDNTYSSGGETVHTLVSRPVVPSVKRPRMDASVVMNTGYVIDITHQEG